jgi:hypothetical protein
MTRDNRERLALYARADVEVRRIALNMDQVRQYNLPPNFAKESDTRFGGYVAQFGTSECWELDALDPTVIANLIRTEIESLINQDSWQEAMSGEEESRELLGRVSENWTKVKKLVGG